MLGPGLGPGLCLRASDDISVSSSSLERIRFAGSASSLGPQMMDHGRICPFVSPPIKLRPLRPTSQSISRLRFVSRVPCDLQQGNSLLDLRCS